MTLSPNTTLGHYNITSKIGAGGMGEVYIARDTRLDREVAIKIVLTDFSGDGDRLQRFEQEARATSALNHPNILTVYDVGTYDGSPYIVAELLEGEELRQRLDEGPIPLRKTIDYAHQIISGLSAAHEKGIVHRDLKPENLFITKDDRVKILDFGIAKLRAAKVDANSSEDATRRAITNPGVVMGTVGYMSPEQVRGHSTDYRSDIFSFGAILYEMITGRRAFRRETMAETMSAILKEEPDELTDSNPNISPSLERIVRRCLEKKPERRFQSTSDLGFALEALSTPSSSGASRTQTALTLDSAAPEKLSGWRSRSWISALVVAACALALVATTYGLTRWLLHGTAPADVDVAHVSVVLPDGDELGLTSQWPIALSEDGNRVAYAGLRGGKTQLFVRTLSDAAPRALDGTEGCQSPFFSPDGQWIAFFAESKLRKIAVGGAAMQTLADAPFSRGGAWGSDGFIYFAPTNIGGIWRVPEGGGTATEVTRKDPASGEISHRWPHLVAGSNMLLFAVWTGPGNDEHNVAIQEIGSKDHHILVKGGDAPRYVPKLGMLVYVRLGELFAVSWRPSNPDLGRAVPVAMSERINEIGTEGSGNYAVSGAGTLAYVAGGRSLNAAQLVWTERTGKVEPLPLPERDYENVMISPDGARAIVQIRGGKTELWIYDFARSTITPIGESAGSSQSPLWTADGTHIIYRGTSQGLRNLSWRMADGSGIEERLATKQDAIQTPTSVSSDGHWLVFNENSAQEPGGVNIWLMQLDGDRTPRHFFTAPAGESDGQFSPDGKWLAYQASVSSRQEIYVSPFPGPGPRRQVSMDGGIEPLWSRDGRELFFQNGSKLMSASVSPGTEWSASQPHVVHEGGFVRGPTGNTSWSITRDGTRFLHVQLVESDRAITHVELVLNWFSELKERLGSSTK
ncbi:MAG TPA: protein kinase [Pyrinomonadaceae bacterium]|jgi:Serine/threonine protein kinase|nr:protein kinase [Pyrinomonadaceae bacterium]